MNSYGSFIAVDMNALYLNEHHTLLVHCCIVVQFLIMSVTEHSTTVDRDIFAGKIFFSDPIYGTWNYICLGQLLRLHTCTLSVSIRVQ